MYMTNASFKVSSTSIHTSAPRHPCVISWPVPSLPEVSSVAKFKVHLLTL